MTTGFPVRIRLELYKQGIDWQSILVLALSLGVVVGVGLAIRELNNDRRLKKELAEQMREARDLAESANKTKSEFVANISHELRTPLTAILGYADLSLRSDTPQRQVQENLQNIVLNGQNLLMLINDLLDHSKLEAGYLDIRKERFDLRAMLTEIFRATEPQARAKELGFRLSTSTWLPRHIHSDPLRFRQIVLNILSNAFKFTDHGQVELHIQLEPSMGEPECLALRVIDSGIGIAPHHQQKIFQTFSQADASISRQFGGTGLGLALARNLAHLLGGQLDLEKSVLEEGSCFLLKLPLSQEERDQCQIPEQRFSISELTLENLNVTPPSPLPRLDGKRILLVEDSADLQQLLQEYLRRAGAKVELVGDGESAVQLFLAFERFDAVLMDIQLPGADGYTTTEAIRRLGLVDIPILALTAHAGEQERERSIHAGCNAYLAKPFAPEKLIETLKSCFPLGDPIPPAIDAPIPQPQTPEDKDVWDDPKLREVRSNFILGLGHRLEEMQKAHTLSQRERLARLAHTLKGTAAHFGIPLLSQAAQDLEHEIQQSSGEFAAPSEALLRIKTLTDHLAQGLAWAPEVSSKEED